MLMLDLDNQGMFSSILTMTAFQNRVGSRKHSVRPGAISKYSKTHRFKGMLPRKVPDRRLRLRFLNLEPGLVHW